MKSRTIWVACLLALISLSLNFQLAFAHETITAGPYEIESGWLSEPPVVGQQNAIVVNVSDTGSGTPQPVEDVSSLTVTVSYGGQSKVLTLQPLGEDTPGQFVAPILPTVPGQYTLIFSGKLGDTAINQVEVEPEEVGTADALQFPNQDPADQRMASGGTGWLTYLNLLVSLVALGMGVVALRKAS